ncbi:MAG: ADYC domain-containing protein [Myxococcota bacterium]|nr:ADYC domain-containing protein [Myxococcota bacterium]
MAALCLNAVFLSAACGEENSTSPPETLRPALEQPQGVSLNGEVLNEGGEQWQGPVLNEGGEQWQGPRLEGHSVEGATLHGRPLSSVRVEAGELLAEQDGQLLRGEALVGAMLRARVVDPSGAIAFVEHRISAISLELPQYDPAPSGRTYLYTVHRYSEEAQAWTPLCSEDREGGVHAIPIAAVWDAGARRVELPGAVTFACTAGAIGKCYRWGYRPWLAHPDGAQVMKDAHQTCTRLTRADYCGDGRPHTQTGTRIMVWDTLTEPGPFQTYARVEGNHFEAAWNTEGAVCLSHPRWIYPGEGAWVRCADRRLSPCTAQDRQASRQAMPGAPRLFTESGLNIGL